AISRKLWLSAQSRNTVAACINMVAGATNAFNGTATVLLDSEVNQKGIIYAPQQNQSPNSRHFHHIIFCPYWTTPKNTVLLAPPVCAPTEFYSEDFNGYLYPKPRTSKRKARTVRRDRSVAAGMFASTTESGPSNFDG